MVSLSLATERPLPERRPLVDRVRDAAFSFDGWYSVWARSSGIHVLLGLEGEDAFARLTPLGGTQFGLAFRASPARDGSGESDAEAPTSPWEPLLLIDELEQVVEHALIAEGALQG
jgi:hypothetical protein